MLSVTGSPDNATDPSGETLAIVGAACRFPGGIDSLSQFWQALLDGRDLVGEVPVERFDAERFTGGRPRRPGRSYTAAGGFLTDVTGFDAEFFGISPREATRMDPQQRLLLEMAIEALDDAGTPREALAGSDTGVYIGVSSRDYSELQQSDPDSINAYMMAGSAATNTANRLSYTLDWHGPSMAVDTACSSALTAVHRACEDLRAGRSRTALAGGINVLLSPYSFIGFSAASMLSPTGRCRTFSADADGYVRAEGGGVILLKRLKDALADGDRVHATILATGVNSDGRTSALALPSESAQEALLRQVYARAEVTADDLAYLELHGTGTPVGDPIECRAIGRALSSHRTLGPLPVGSVKTNIGHLEAASGIAGLLKALLVLRHRRVPPTLHAEPLNPAIDFASCRLRPALDAEPLVDAACPVVGVNSFGFGGANAHVALAPAAPFTLPRPPAEEHHRLLPVVVSARTEEGLVQAAERMADRLSEAGPRNYYDLAWTACRRRTRHEKRAAVLATTSDEAADALRLFARSRQMSKAPVVEGARSGKVGFVFSGNGSQWAGMGTELMAQEPVFRTAVEEADAALTPYLGWSVRDRFIAEELPNDLHRTDIAQPMLFAVQRGLVALLDHYGVRPSGVVGHSVGEIAAAHTAGALSLEDAARVVAARSHAQAPTADRGRMAAVGLSADDVRAELALFNGSVELAAVNSPRDVTVAGPASDLETLGKNLKGRGVFFRPLDLAYAFHSRAMDPIEQPLLTALAGLDPSATAVPFASTVTGSLLGGEELDGVYWWRNVRRPVLFSEAVGALLDSGCDVFTEIGPHPVLSTYLRRLTTEERSVPATVVRTCSNGDSGTPAVRRSVGHLLACGAQVDWDSYFPLPGQVTDLPGYPWQRQRHWNGTPQWWTRTGGEDAEAPAHRLLGARMAVAEPTWSGPLVTTRLPWLADHTVGGAIVVPAAAYVEAAFAAAREHDQVTPVEVTALAVTRALTLPRDEDAEPDTLLQVSLSADDRTVTVSSRSGGGGDWRTHAKGRARRLLRPTPAPLDPVALGQALPRRLSAQDHYAQAAATGLTYGPAFQVLTQLRVGHGEVLAAYRLDQPSDGFHAHPALLDGALQAGAPLLPAGTGSSAPYLPALIEAARMWDSPTPTGFVHVRSRKTSAHEVCWDVTVLDEDGRVTVELEGCRLRRFAGGRTGTPVERYETVLRAAPRPGPHPPPLALSLHLPSEDSGHRSRTDERPASVMLTVADSRTETDTVAAGRYCKEASAHFAAAALARFDCGGEYAPDRLVAAGMRPAYRKLAALLLALSEEHGLARRVPGRPGAWSLTDTPRPHEVFRSAVVALPQFADALALYGRCGLRLSEVLRGAQGPLELLFGETDRHLLEELYGRIPGQQDQLRISRQSLAAAVRDWPADRVLRVLEVGGGTGGATRELLDVLPPERTQYVFTDVSAGFFPRVRERFSDHRFVDFRTLDLDRHPAEQGFAGGAFDLVVAHNVLHATADLRNSLGHAGWLLAEGGQLMALEQHDAGLLALCFGLLDSFWSVTDTDSRRPDSPLLSAPAWTALLRECGYQDIHRTGDQGGTSSLLLARRTAVTSTPPSTPDRIAAEQRPSTAGTDVRWVVAAETPASPLPRSLCAALAADERHQVHCSVPSTDPDHWAQWLRGRTSPVHLVLVLGEEEQAVTVPETAIDLAVRRTAVFAAIASAFDRDATVPLSVWLVTRPCGVAPPPESVTHPGDAAAWGAARCLGNEHPGITVRCVSLEPDEESGAGADRLSAELLDPSEELEVVLTRAGRFVPRLSEAARTRPVREPDAAAGTERGAYRLELRDPGLEHRLVWVPERLPAPGPDQVLIEVRAAGLNYRDVMLATGLLPAGAEPDNEAGPGLGLECAGTVVRTGADVTGLTAGDRVVAMSEASACLASHVVVDRALVGRIPDEMGFVEAATLPVAALTVRHSLHDVARLAPGETLLLHGAAGGVGLAALRFARERGARVLATAGTPAKRDLLRLLGADHVLDSRSLRFADEVRTLTNGRGVDVVLNSLAGEGLARSMELLADGGRFVELGKRDIHTDGHLAMRAFRHNTAFFGVDLLRLLAQHSLRTAGLREFWDDIETGVCTPLPHRDYPADRVEEAFRVLRHSRHIGKVVVTFDEPPAVEHLPRPAPLDPGATYLITGGLTGLGAAIARHLAARGARHLALLGRRGPETPEAGQLLDALADSGAHAIAYPADLSDGHALDRVLRMIDATGRPLKGIVHAAARYDDAPLSELGQQERIRAVLGPKMLGALLLETRLRDRPLDFFVSCSSIAAHIGNRQQAAYGGANLFLEAHSRSRHRAGRPGLAIAWGALSDTGFTHRTEELATSLERRGLTGFSAAEACAALDTLLAEGAEATVVGRFDWPRMQQVLSSIASPRFAEIAAGNHLDGTGGGEPLREQLAQACAEQALELVTEALVGLTAGVLQTSPDRLDRNRPLDQLGLDSLMAAELVVATRRRLGCELPALEIIGAGGLTDLARRALTRLGHTPAATTDHRTQRSTR
ncbi:SDR family NAD(P)-dependent oxidoreductase [Streptomyces sp. NPDC003006]